MDFVGRLEKLANLVITIALTALIVVGLAFALWGCGAAQRVKTTTEAQIACVESAVVSLFAKLALGETKAQIALELAVEGVQCSIAGLTITREAPHDAGVGDGAGGDGS